MLPCLYLFILTLTPLLTSAVRSCAVKAVSGIKSINEASRPDEFELKLAIKLDSEMGAVIAKVSAGAQLEVTMKWKSDKKP